MSSRARARLVGSDLIAARPIGAVALPRAERAILSGPLPKPARDHAQGKRKRAIPPRQSMTAYEVTAAPQPVPKRPRLNSSSKTPLLDRFQQKYLTINPAAAFEHNIGKTPVCCPIGDGQERPEELPPTMSNSETSTTTVTRSEQNSPTTDLPTPADLRSKSAFGPPDKSRSFTQEGCGESILHAALKYGTAYMTEDDLQHLRASHPLVAHLDDMRNKLAQYDFTWIRDVNTNWATQRQISVENS